MNSLIPTHVIHDIERKCNDVVCPECGKNHHVDLLCRKGVVSLRFSDDACEGFKEAVNSLVKTEVTRFLIDPLPLIR